MVHLKEQWINLVWNRNKDNNILWYKACFPVEQKFNDSLMFTKLNCVFNEIRHLIILLSKHLVRETKFIRDKQKQFKFQR